MPAIKYKKKTYAGATFPVLELTKAEYDALPDAKKMDGTVYMITDDDGGWEAERSTYDNTTSGLTATNVQDALDEVANKTSTSSNFTSQVVNFSNHSLRKTDNLVVFTGSINALSAATATWHTVGTLPSGYRPVDNVFFSGCDAWGQMFLIQIYSTGEITLWLDGGSYGNGYLHFNMSWFTA